jgi:ubiquinone/menaquinone biosynthesis C-methylase UbiE
MEHFHRIYTHDAVRYRQMIAAEDADGQLRAILLDLLQPNNGKRIVDLGTGTGRLPSIFAKEHAFVIGLDIHPAMLRQNQKVRAASGADWELILGDMSSLPIPTGWADAVTAAWSLGHFCGWYPHEWHARIASVLKEMHRIARPLGRLLILETLATGAEHPNPPTPALEAYYRWLEMEWGFERRILRTDYLFASVDEAVERTAFFFGEALASTIRAKGWKRIPEWTGLWTKQMPSG